MWPLLILNQMFEAKIIEEKNISMIVSSLKMIIKIFYLFLQHCQKQINSE